MEDERFRGFISMMVLCNASAIIEYDPLISYI